MRLEIRSSVKRLVSMVRESVSYWAFGLFFMIYLWIDAAMLSLLTNSTVVGWYGVPTKLFQTMMFVPVILSTAWLPRLVSAFEESPQQLHRLSRKPIELVLLLGLPIAGAIAAAAGPIVHVLYGAAYGNSVPVMVILGLCIPPMYLNIMFGQVLTAAKRQTVWTWAMVGATVVNPAANAVLIPVTQARFHNGAIGAAISLLVTELLIAGFGFALLGRAVIARHAGRRLALTAVASIAMWSVAFVLRGLGTVPSLAAAGLTFAVLATIFRLVTPDERAFVRERLGRVARRLPDSLRRRMALAPLAMTRSRS
jgi:O-antigen/teichoic acid export membrane protein